MIELVPSLIINTVSGMFYKKGANNAYKDPNFHSEYRNEELHCQHSVTKNVTFNEFSTDKIVYQWKDIL